MTSDTRNSQTQAADLTTPVQFLKGVGPQRAELLEKLRLKSARDVLFFFPRKYEDMNELRPIAELETGELASVCGTVEEVELRNTGPGRSLLGVLVRDQSSWLRAVWFNQPYMQQKFEVGRRVLLAGEPRMNGGRWEMAHPRVEQLGDHDPPPAGRILPVYSLTDGISQRQMRRLVSLTVESLSEQVDEVFPDEFLERYRLLPIRRALPQMHQPATQTQLDDARRRFIYQELLVMQLALAMRRQRLRRAQQAVPLPADARIDSRILNLFPFNLTDDQRRAIDEVASDMAAEVPMNRLLQGDVGSGKTVIAIYAMLLAVAHGCQSALMAPTEVLARQHFRTLSVQLGESRVRLGLLTGSSTARQRRETLAAVKAGEVDLIVGTHAILSSGVEFAKLGLVVIDEQHKFGVRQRATLKQAGMAPHYLVMSATPIPRTVSMTMFGDLDVSSLRETPPGRQTVHTYLGKEQERDRWWDFFRKKVREGRQGYVITPLVDEPSETEIASVEQAFEDLANGQLEAFRIGLIHGRMAAEEKDAVMKDFAQGNLQVLVATSVVEVGIDVGNATMMTIESGERFGLSQLHQLRGRISRGVHPGYLCVFADASTDEAHQRLEAFVATTDGFALAEKDFQMRGPGDLFSTRQHGLPPLRIADLQRDHKLLEDARRDAQELVGNDPELRDPKLARLRRMVVIRYGKALDLGDVG